MTTNPWWIPITKSVPPMTDAFLRRSDHVLVATSDNGFDKLHIAYHRTYENDEFPAQWIMDGPDAYELKGVTHWMWLPLHPNKG